MSDDTPETGTGVVYGLIPDVRPPALRSRVKKDPHQNVVQILINSGNELRSRPPLEPSFGAGSSRSSVVFFQKKVALLYKVGYAWS